MTIAGCSLLIPRMSAMQQDLFSLRLFVSICETSSITRAAEQLNIAVSAASRRVGLLEHSVGLPLLLRKPHGVQPTAAGLLVLRYARDVMHLGQQLESSLEEIAAARTAKFGSSLRVPCSSNAWPLISRCSRASIR